MSLEQHMNYLNEQKKDTYYLMFQEQKVAQKFVRYITQQDQKQRGAAFPPSSIKLKRITKDYEQYEKV